MRMPSADRCRDSPANREISSSARDSQEHVAQVIGVRLRTKPAL